jgi:ATP-dependent exoDNAse (exonuclease V) alpha subunit
MLVGLAVLWLILMAFSKADIGITDEQNANEPERTVKLSDVENIINQKISQLLKSIEQEKQNSLNLKNKLVTEEAKYEVKSKQIELLNAKAARHWEEMNSEIMRLKQENRDLKESVSRLNVGIEDDVEIENIILKPGQQKAYEEIINPDNKLLYITGKAGTGKSVLLKYFMKSIDADKINAAVVAPTGLAAVHVGGQTIHSFFKIPAEDIVEIKDISISPETKEMVQKLDILLIDEVSMVRVDIMHIIDFVLREMREKFLPFGGLKIVMFGDLYQLPPVVKKQKDGALAKYFDDTYGGEYFFFASVFRKTALKVCELTEVVRQTDLLLINTLNKIRVGDVSQELLDKTINQRVVFKKPDKPYLTLTGRNDVASNINNEKLAELAGGEYLFEAVIDGKFGEKSFPTEKELKIKVGAQVMTVKNEKTGKYVNGSFGIVSGVSSDGILLRFSDGVEHLISRYTWKNIKYVYDAETKELKKETIGTFTQYPVRLAWAVTVHKAQGQTYGTVKIDVARAFADGQMYVALSRCKSLDGIYLKKPVEVADIQVNQNVVAFMKNTKVIQC